MKTARIIHVGFYWAHRQSERRNDLIWDADFSFFSWMAYVKIR